MFCNEGTMAAMATNHQTFETGEFSWFRERERERARESYGHIINDNDIYLYIYIQIYIYILHCVPLVISPGNYVLQHATSI
jgi:hypothetical protein